MKVIEKGRPQRGWSVATFCTGDGNGGGGCGAKLLVEEPDLYKTSSSARDEVDYYTTFRCCECGVETDLKGVPTRVFHSIPWKLDHPQFKLKAAKDGVL